MIFDIIHTIIFYLLRFLYTYTELKTYEDRFQLDKCSDEPDKNMNIVKISFSEIKDFVYVKSNVLRKLNDVCRIYNCDKEHILLGKSNKMHVWFEYKTIYIGFNHYYISGSFMFEMLNAILDSPSPVFLKSEFGYALYYLPLYIWSFTKNYLSYSEGMLTVKNYPQYDSHVCKFVEIKNIDINTPFKRYYCYLQILRRVYMCSKKNRPITVGLSVAFEPLPYLNNNVGLIIFQYDIKDDVMSLKKKIESEMYQVYVSNFCLNLPSFGGLNIRRYLDCILSTMYIKTSMNFTIGWNCKKSPEEELYIGCVSIYKGESVDLNACFSSCSQNYKDEDSVDFL